MGAGPGDVAALAIERVTEDESGHSVYGTLDGHGAEIGRDDELAAVDAHYGASKPLLDGHEVGPEARGRDHHGKRSHAGGERRRVKLAGARASWLRLRDSGVAERVTTRQAGEVTAVPAPENVRYRISSVRVAVRSRPASSRAVNTTG